MNGLPAPPLPPFIQSMLPSGIRRYRVDVGGYRMHVMEVGEGLPVLMLHGNPTWGFLYRKVADQLARESLRIILPDLIGLGFSDKPKAYAEHQLNAHARWLGALLDQLQLKKLVFVGQDWGGPIGIRALADRPSHLAGLVVLNTVLGPPRPGFRPTAFHRFARIPIASDLVFRGLQFPQSTLHMAQGDRQSIRGDVARAYRYPLRGLRNNVAPLALARMVPHSFDHPTIEPLRRCQSLIENFKGPTAIVWGDRDPILGRAIGWITRLLPNASVTRTQAGHFLQEEVPREIAQAIRDVAKACV